MTEPNQTTITDTSVQVVPPAAAATAPGVTPSPNTAEAPAAGVNDNTSNQTQDNKPTEDASTATVLGASHETKTETSTQDAAQTAKAPEQQKTENGAEKETASTEKEGSQSAESASPPTYDAFKMPDGSPIAQESVDGFTKMLGEFELNTKTSHAEVQKLGQALLDRHVAELTSFATTYQKAQEEQIKTQSKAWHEAFVADPEFGGNKQETTTNAALEFISTHGGLEQQQKELKELLNKTGLGNHPTLIRLFAIANKESAEGKPVPATAPTVGIKDKIVKRYGTR